MAYGALIGGHCVSLLAVIVTRMNTNDPQSCHCSACQRALPIDDYYSYTLASTGKRIRDQRCKQCRKILTNAVNRKRYAIVKQRELDRVATNRAAILASGDPFYTPVVFKDL